MTPNTHTDPSPDRVDRLDLALEIATAILGSILVYVLCWLMLL